MSDKRYFEICLDEIEKKLNRGSRKDWTDPDFKELRNNIYAHSGITVSTHTLKRLFGKIKYKSLYSLQLATREAIAKYLGYDSWSDFENAFPEKSENPDPTGISLFFNSIVTWYLGLKFPFKAGILFLLFSGIIFLVIRLILSNSSEFQFIVEDSIGFVPHTVTIRYDVSQLQPDRTFIDYDFNHPVLGYQSQKIESDSNQVFFTYQIPGVYRPKLKHKNEFVDSSLVVAKSNGWTGFFQDEKSYYYLYWLSNTIPDVINDHHLTLPRKIINKYGFDTTSVYSTAFRNIMDFGLSGDDFRFSTRFKNGLETGGITCFDVNFIFYFENTTNHIRLVEENCQSWCKIKYSDLLLDGHTSELKSLSGKFNNWTRFELLVENKNIVIKIENKEVFQGSFSESCGNLFGMEYRFKGSGMIDFISFFNKEDEEIYFDDFGNN